MIEFSLICTDKRACIDWSATFRVTGNLEVIED